MTSGMSYSPSDLVGIPFPYSDLKTKKKRPVLVITHPDGYGDFICVAVTSVPTPEYAVAIDDASMSAGNLPRQSWIRCNKLFTLYMRIQESEYRMQNKNGSMVILSSDF
ncbi:type II toxin-antitoxin system PemK/MazF family toxin [Desulfobacterium sp. N47]|uniref:type II toxin-antitoxin system PemK/MazF family toxin n=1 Tax=Desulfobacterium sp. N47 TaxID=3115210 RepID=UPI003F4A0CF7